MYFFTIFSTQQYREEGFVECDVNGPNSAELISPVNFEWICSLIEISSVLFCLSFF
jgi:hypothetical protein